MALDDNHRGLRIDIATIFWARFAPLGACFVLLAPLLVASARAGAQAETSPGSPQVFVLAIEGPIGPATSEYVVNGLERAREAAAAAVVLQMDTPGGLDTSMREIVRAILASPIPVVGYIAPRGARGASAGTFIMYATHVAAMAPGTNLGAATPVAITGGAAPGGEPEGDEGSERDAGETKAINDAAAFLRSLAQLRGRNAEWAERAVRQGESLPAEAARKRNVIELIAPDLETLLDELDGRKVETTAGTERLETAGARVVSVEPSWRTKLLGTLANPNLALILMMIGVYGLIFELANPGAGVPGVLGATSLLVGLYALHVLPVNYAGLGLLALGTGLMVAEAFTPSFGLLGLGGLAAFAIGATFLVDRVPGFSLSPWVIAVTTGASALFLLLVLHRVIQTRRQPSRSGGDALLGGTGTVLEWSNGSGTVQARGERWQAESDRTLAPGQRVSIVSRHGLKLRVTPEDPHHER